MTRDYSALEERIRAARAELDTVLAQAERELSRFKRENQPTDEEREQLQEAALRGELGDDMRQLAERIDRGEDTWAAVFAGESPNTGLLRGHVDRMIAETRDAIAEALEDDEVQSDLEQARRDAESREPERGGPEGDNPRH